MLTPDQIKLRRRDNEMRKLRLEKQALEDKIAKIRIAFSALLRGMAKHANFCDAVRLLELAAELDDAK